MINYFDKILYLYPNIQRVMYWHTQQDGTPWDDAYDGIVWENTEIEKPSKENLDALDDSVVEAELAARNEAARKSERNARFAQDLGLVANYQNYIINNPATFSEYLDYLENQALMQL